MLTGILGQVRNARYLLNENSTTVLTGVGVAGVVATAYLTGRATVKAVDMIEKAENVNDIEEATTAQKVRLVWSIYIPPVLMGAITIASIIAANRIATRRVAALVVASGISERALKEYKERVVEKMGESKARDMQDEIAADRVKNISPLDVVITNMGDVLCYDMHTGRYFKSSHEALKRAENAINYALVHYCSASLTEFYDELGLTPTSYSDMVGWDINAHMELVISTVLSEDNRPCLAFDFSNPPTYEYNRHRYGP